MGRRLSADGVFGMLEEDKIAHRFYLYSHQLGLAFIEWSRMTGTKRITPLALLMILCGFMLQLTASLRFNSRGKFKILQVADMHYADGATTKCQDLLPEQYATCSDLNTTAFVKRMIAAEKPDLIIFTGDNIYASDSSNPVASLDAAFAPAVEAKVAWAAVLGNHDQESSLNRAGVMSHIVHMDYTLSQFNPAMQHGSSIDGFGNYNLEVFGVHGSELQHKSVLNLYFVDSGDYSTDPKISGYGWVKASQQAWLKNVSASLQNAYQSPPNPQPTSSPALVYFHIPLPEVNNFTASDIVGVKQEQVGSPEFNSGFLDTLVELGDVKAAFTGHDHVNDFCGKLRGINLCYAGGFGYHAYGKAGWSRRARIVEASLQRDSSGSGDWQGVKEITTWKSLDDEALSRIDTQVL